MGRVDRPPRIALGPARTHRTRSARAEHTGRRGRGATAPADRAPTARDRESLRPPSRRRKTDAAGPSRGRPFATP